VILFLLKVNNLYIGEQHDRYNYVENQIKEGLKHYLVIDDESRSGGPDEMRAIDRGYDLPK
jgi:hypothetical protein